MALSIHINFTAWCFCVQHAFLSEQILIKFVLHYFTVVLVASLSHYQMLQFELHKINKGILTKVFCLLFCKQNFFIMPAQLFSSLLHFGKLQKDCLNQLRSLLSKHCKQPASSPGALAAVREKEEELLTTSLEFEHLHQKS